MALGTDALGTGVLGDIKVSVLKFQPRSRSMLATQQIRRRMQRRRK